MAFPDPEDTITLTGTFTTPVGGTPASGRVVLTPSTRLVDAADDRIYTGGGSIALDVDGSFSVTLLRTDATGVLPEGWRWQVDEQPTGGTRTTYWIELTADLGPTVDLADIAPVSGPGGGTVSGVQSVNGQDGVVVLDAADVGADAAGSAAAAQTAAVSAAATDATAKVTAHEADTTAVHGIADAAALATDTEVATAVSDHSAATDPHGDRAYADGKLAKTANLSDVSDTSTARSNLGLGTSATRAVGTGSGDVAAGDAPATQADTAVTAHEGDTDPHGDRAWATSQFQPLTGTPRPSVPYGFKAWTFDPVSLANTNAAAATSGTLFLVGIYPAASFTTTSVIWAVSVAGVTPTASQNWVGIYDSTGALLGSTGVDGDVASTGVKTTALAVALTGGQAYWIGFLMNAATAPQLPRGGGQPGSGVILNAGLSAANYRFATNGTSQTAMPASITPSSNGSGSAYWAAVI